MSIADNPPQRAPIDVRMNHPAGQTAPARDRDASWIDSFNKQLDSKLYREALGTARRMVARLQEVGVATTAEEMVANVVADTWLGVLTWTPGPEWSLTDHIKTAIRSRARHEWHRARRFPTTSLDQEGDERDDEGERAAPLWAEVENALAAESPSADASLRGLAQDVLGRLRELAAGDPEILQMLDAMAAGVTERAALMRALGLSARQYERARRRLERVIGLLPAELALPGRASTGARAQDGSGAPVAPESTTHRSEARQAA